MSVREVAGILRTSLMTVYRLVKIGELSAHRVGRGIRIPEDSVRDYLKRSLVDPSTLPDDAFESCEDEE